jgi:hypothetical protein
MRALTFSELEDTLRYDVLCNLGRCVPENERLSYLGQAISLQPDRREAYFYIANHWGREGKLGQDVWGREGLYGFAPPEGSLLELGRGDL